MSDEDFSKLKKVVRDSYYQMYRDRLNEQTCYCDVCEKELKGWQIVNHDKSKKHLFRLMSPEEQLDHKNMMKEKRHYAKMKRMQEWNQLEKTATDEWSKLASVTVEP
jgi:hypothetical protein